MGFSQNTQGKLKIIDLSNAISVAHTNGTNTQTLKPSAGNIYIIRSLYYYAADPVGSSAGTHQVEFILTDGSLTIYTNKIKATTGNDISLDPKNGFIGDSLEVPVAATDQLRQIHGYLWCSNSIYYEILYTNNTDVAQAGTRTCRILVEEIPERG